MSQQNDLRETLTAASLSIVSYLEQTQAKALLEKEEEMRSAIDKEADRFFAYIRDYLMLWTSGSTPGLIRSYTSWKPLTRRWMLQKLRKSRRVKKGQVAQLGDRVGASTADKHYRGLTGKMNSYIKEVAKAGHANKVFGNPVARMAFGDGTSSVIVDKTVLTKTGRLVAMGYRPDGKYGFITTVGAKPSFVIKAFPNLQGIPANETALASWVGEATGQTDQWMKVVGKNKTGKPLRPMILPMLKWYVDVGFPRAINKAIKR